MNRKDLVEKFETAFQNPEKVKADEYQKIIEANAMKASENAERLTFLLLGVVTIFILIVQGRVKKIDLGLVEIDDPSIILIAIPLLIGYIHYDLITTLSKFDQLSVIHKAITKQRHKPIHEERLTKYFLFLPTLYENNYLSTEGIVYYLQSYLWLLGFLSITVVIPLGSEFIAFSKISALSGPEYSLLLTVSIVITVMLNLQSVLTILTLFKGIRDN